jgi:hypothetical protein
MTDDGRLPKSIVNRQDGAPGVTGNDTDALAFEQANGHLGASQCFIHGVLLAVGGLTGRLQNKTPAGLRRRGLGKAVYSALPDPRRRVHNDAYDDYAYDDRLH